MSSGARWIELMSDPQIRVAFTAGLAGTYGLIAWVIGQRGVVRKIAAEARPYYSAMVGAAGIALGFFSSVLIPGLIDKEMSVAFAAAGGVTWATHALFGERAKNIPFLRKPPLLKE